MADFSKRGPGCDDSCDGEGGERGERGRRGKRGPRGHDGKDGRDGRDGFPSVTDPTPPTLRGDGSPENPLQVINVAPEPFVHPPQVITIYVRATGDDANDGTSPETALRTVQAATLLIPRFIPEGVYYVIDATDLIDGGPEVLPPNYALPVWKAARAAQFAFSFGFPNPPLAVEASVLGAVTLKANPRDVPALGAEAIIEEGDLETTVVGTSIGSTTAGPITVETLTPHNLVQSPFGIEGAFEGLVQLVLIEGAADPNANGVFLALVTQPTNAQSTTFELWDFDPNTETFFQVNGVGGGAGGTVTVFFVQDQFSGQTQVKVSSARTSWLPNGSLKGKILVDGSGDQGVIYDNTADTLYLTHNRGSVSFDNGPVRIMEQTCVLQCSDSELFGFIGGFNVENQDSFAMIGIEIKASADGSSFFQFSGLCFVDSCKLENPAFISVVHQAFVGNSYLIRPFYFRSNIYQNRDLVENQEVSDVPAWDAFQGTVFIQDDGPPLSNPLGGALNWFGVKIISSTDPVVRVVCEDAFLIAVSIEDGSGDAVSVETQGRCVLLSTGGSGWPGFALVVDNGAQVEVDRFTFADDDEMIVGLPLNPGVTGLPPRTFGNFRSGADGGFVRQQLDIQGLSPVDPERFGAAGTVSRVFQREP